MANYLNRPSIFEIATAFEDGKNGEIKPKTNVVVNTSRLWYGDDSTVSAFIATAYDEQGNRVDSMEGYFLEPATDYGLAKVANKDRAIMSGTYNIIPRQKMLEKENARRKRNGESELGNLKYDWYIDDVPGRSGIAIHIGNYGKDTEGCFLPGNKVNYDSITNKFSVSNSTKKTEELFDFFNNYGQNGIEINITPEVSGLIE